MYIPIEWKSHKCSFFIRADQIYRLTSVLQLFFIHFHHCKTTGLITENFPLSSMEKPEIIPRKTTYAYNSNGSLCPKSIIFRSSLLVKSMLVSLLSLVKFSLTVVQEFRCRKKWNTWEEKYKKGWRKKPTNLFVKIREGQSFSIFPTLFKNYL